MIQVPLSRGLFALIDDENAAVILQHKWSIRQNKRRFYATRNTSKKTGELKTKVQMHRFIIGAKEGEQVDHINGNSLDNRRCNLRIATTSVNRANSKAQVRTKSKMKGVYARGRNRYEAFIGRNGDQFRSKWFKDPHKAALLRDEMARLLYPEGIYLNFPGEQCPGDLKEYARQLISG